MRVQVTHLLINVDKRADRTARSGMPLGLMPDMVYEEKDAKLHPGESMMMYSDGLLEAHNPEGEMFGLLRIRELMATPNAEKSGSNTCLANLHALLLQIGNKRTT